MNNVIEAFEHTVLHFCTKHALFPGNAGDGVLVALSGGGDSVALLAALARNGSTMGFRIEAAHLNHALRGADSDGDEAFCRDLCAALDIPLTVHTLKKGELTETKGSIETSAREARIAFLERTAAAAGLGRIATGHTRDDQAETVLQRMIRGTGPAGLSGIRPIRDDRWIRPLLAIRREDARSYLAALGLEFREDATNRDPAYFRNRIRHELIPLLRGRFSPGIEPALVRLAELSQIQEDYLEQQIREAYHTACLQDNPHQILLDKTTFTGYHTLIRQRLVRHCLDRLEGAGRSGDRDEVERILAIATERSGSTDVTDTVRFGASRRFLAFTKGPVPYELPVAVTGETLIPGGAGSIVARRPGYDDIHDGRMRILVAPAVFERHGSLTVGPVRRGESMTPWGLGRRVRIRELASTAAIPVVVRDHLPVVRSGDEPLWVPGLKSSERLKTAGAIPGRDAVLFEYAHGVRWDRRSSRMTHDSL